MDRDRIDKLLELNRIYNRLPKGYHWEFNREDIEQNFFLTLIKIGRGIYEPKESEIRKYNLIRKFFLLEIWELKAYLTTGSLIETDNMNIYTDETVRLGQDILTLKEILGIPSWETNFEIFQNNNSKIWIESRFIHPKNLNLRIGNYRLKFCYSLNSQKEVVLLYCPRCNNRAFYRFEGADTLLKYLNDKYIMKSLSPAFARTEYLALQ